MILFLYRELLYIYKSFLITIVKKIHYDKKISPIRDDLYLQIKATVNGVYDYTLIATLRSHIIVNPSTVFKK